MRKVHFLSRLTIGIGLVIFFFLGALLMRKNAVGLKNQYRVALFTKNNTGHERSKQGFLSALGELGQQEYQVDVYCTKALDKQAATAAVEEALLRGSDILVSIGAEYSQIAKSVVDRRGSKIPIVFIGAANPVGLGLIESEGRPGGNVTGANFAPDSDTLPARVLHMLQPKMKRLLLPYCFVDASGHLDALARTVERFFAQKGVDVILVPFERVDDVLLKVKPYIARVDALMVLEGCSSFEVFAGISKLCKQHAVPFFSSEIDSVKYYAPFGFGGDFRLSGKAAFSYVHRILSKKEDPALLPVCFVSHARRIVINPDLFDSFGVEIAPDILLCLSRGTVVSKYGEC